MKLDFSGLAKLNNDILRDFIGFEFEAPRLQSYPPYNIVKQPDDGFLIELAVAGFGKDDIEITSHEGLLVVSGRQAAPEQVGYLHKGISDRSFERKFVLEKHVFVDGADYSNGILTIKLKKVLPEELKPRKIEIGTGGTPKRQILMETSNTEAA